MKKAFLTLSFFLISFIQLWSQELSWSPAFAKDNDVITITLDASKGNQGLYNYATPSDVYVHVGVITNLSTSSADWKYVKFTWGTTTPAAQATSLGGNLWQYQISNIRSFFGVPANETIQKICILFRSGNGSVVQRNADASDMYVPVYSTSLAVRFSVPPFQPTYIPVPETITKQVGDNIGITAIANATADNMKISLNGSVIATSNSVSTLSASPTLSSSGSQLVVTEATVGATTKTDTLRFFVSAAPTIAALPPGVRDGINYEAGNTSVVLVLYAPGKSRVSVIGDFPGSNWQEQTQYVMNKTPDGNYWWIRITGLTSGTEYGFQYLVDGSLKTGDPYAEKILDPSNDGTISTTTYPNIKPYPTGLTTGIVSIFQTNAPAYTWAVPNFNRPDKRNLVVYELLIRDFVDAHDFKTMRDTLTYLKSLGVNAIELMPVNEFDGNSSWGYNPDYFLAPDKYYGPKNTFKEFIDSCHSKGIAVIMDIALNHTTGNNPLAQLYWNSAAGTPAANNPWLNVTATHPYSVFNDFNHESLATRYFTSRVVEHWLQNYKVDGFRFDLSKGFTQFNSGTNVALWGQYDASRVAIWKKYYDTCQLKAPGSYVILEHFADNSEEIELSNYGMMLWGNMAYNFEEASMGYISTSNFDSYLHTARGWSNPYLVSYMESHDEERMMYKNLNFGSNNGTYNIQDLTTALKRIEMCASFLLSAPGPKMFWEFGELGYDFSINRCTDGSVNTNCRLDPKPIRWDYKTVTQRKRLFDIYAGLNKLRFNPWYKDVFIANNTAIDRSLTGAFKWLRVRSANDTSSLVVMGNFDVNAQTGSVTFPTAGTWYDYFGGATITATGASQSFTLQPGEYHIYLNRNLVNAVVTATGGVTNTTGALSGSVFPNPVNVHPVLKVQIAETGLFQADLYNSSGQLVQHLFNQRLSKGTHQLNLPASVAGLPGGIYLIRLQNGTSAVPVKFIVP